MASDMDNDGQMADDMDDNVSGDMTDDVAFSAHLLTGPFQNQTTILGHFQPTILNQYTQYIKKTPNIKQPIQTKNHTGYLNNLSELQHQI